MTNGNNDVRELEDLLTELEGQGALPVGHYSEEDDAVTQLMDAPLPRTTTRKVKRNELVAKLQQRLELKEAPASGDNTRSLVRAAVGAIARRDPATLHPGMSLRGEPQRGDDQGEPGKAHVPGMYRARRRSAMMDGVLSDAGNRFSAALVSNSRRQSRTRAAQQLAEWRGREAYQ